MVIVHDFVRKFNGHGVNFHSVNKLAGHRPLPALLAALCGLALYIFAPIRYNSEE